MKQITELFLEDESPTLSSSYLWMQNLVTTNFSYTYQ